MWLRRQTVFVPGLVLLLGTAGAYAFIDPSIWLTPEHPAIDYWKGPLSDPVTLLEKRRETGQAKLDYAANGLGFCPAF